MTDKTELSYYFADPSGNLTVLVRTPVAPERYAGLGAKLLSCEKTAEQVGFLTFSDEKSVFLQMAGGEFCGNATLCAGVCCLEEYGLSAGVVEVSVFGLDVPLRVCAEKRDGLWTGTAEMPRPDNAELVTLAYGGKTYHLPLVSVGSISHLICGEAISPEIAECAVKTWCRELNVPALGLMQLSGDTLTPLVYVSALDSLYWEHSCASGTCAAAYYLSQKRGRDGLFRFTEPGGTPACEVRGSALTLHNTVLTEKRSLKI